MREILFRGKNKFNNEEWVEGSLLRGTFYYDNREMFAIVPIDNTFYPRCEISSWEEVNPETVGQFTGLFDKNGIAIFEGDIVKLDNSLDTKQKNFEVRFAYGQFYIGINKPVAYIRDSCEVIGNIHDNPELLEGENINETNI